MAFEWTPDGGTTYYELSRIDNTDTEYTTETHYLPASADNNTDLRFRFQVYGLNSYNGMQSGSIAYVDNVYVRVIPD